MSHFFLPPALWSGDELVVLRGDEARHCNQVRRQRVRDVISILNGGGRRAEARITSMQKDAVLCEVIALHDVEPPKVPVTLLQALPKGDGMEWIIEKAVELGVSHIVPVMSERCIVRLDEKDAARKQVRWQKAAVEACKQCGQAWLPTIALPCSVKQALVDTKVLGGRFVASLEADARPLHKLAGLEAISCGLAIGPEGDFSLAEYSLFRDAGWQALHLGPLTLRCETAAISGLAMLQYHFTLKS
jgi:16S rRNA (uracil1498-N3)-methyltransferase